MAKDQTELRTLLAQAEADLNAGRFDAMHAGLQRAFAIEPGALGGLWTYTYGTRYGPGDPVLARIEHYLQRSDLTDPIRSQLLFMSAKAYEDLGQVKPAFDAVVAANALKQAPFNGPAMAALTHRLIATVKATPDIRLAPKGPRLIFVLGMPRSGSSLTAQMLAAHPAITNLGERTVLGPALAHPTEGQNPHLAFLNGLDQTRLETARETYLQDLPETGILIDKMPENYLFAWAIPMLFPDALILHTRREKLATCWSCFKNDFRVGHAYSYDWRALCDHYDRHLALCDLARPRAGTAWHEIALGALTRDPKAVLSPVLQALRLDWDPACATPERAGGDMPTLSKWQVRQGIDPKMAQGWRAFQPLIEARFGPVT